MTDKSVEALIARWHRWRAGDYSIADGVDIGDELADALERERSRNARLVRALKPFARIAETYGPNCNPYAYASIEDCRAARKALEENDE